MRPPTTTLFWFRRDLRLGDNPALTAAVDRCRESGGDLLPVFVWEPRGRRRWTPGDAARWWLPRSLAALDDELRRRGSRLTLGQGDPKVALPELARAAGGATVVWAAGLEPEELADDDDVAAELAQGGVQAIVVPSTNLLVDPAAIRTREGRPYTVFTPYWRAYLSGPPPAEAQAAPETLPAAPPAPAGLALDEFQAEAQRAWAAGFAEVWQPGETGAHLRLARLLTGPLAAYAEERDRPDRQSTSRLSPHLHCGELSARQVWQAVAGELAEAGLDLEAATAPPAWGGEQAPGLRRSAGAFLRQLGWREFGHHLLRHFPQTPEQPLHERFAAFPWRDDPAALEAWRRGQTGYPFVDAGMRELWSTGWMHNRVRLITASFLVKHLLLPWQSGEDWFWDTLVDADLADNALGWQWVAGSGADAAPYFRIFNPVTQGRRYDPDGVYVRRWVPELAGLPAAHIHAPWLAPADVLAAAGITLGEGYPAPIVDHGEARSRALAAYDVVRRPRR
ncbi:MAG: deoxyribodipyrimidine photo-lyase [Actinobacteria bacterium]|nr:deoxyribodipyrimidine photo-lyase [Actinomycetota bacterium]